MTVTGATSFTGATSITGATSFTGGPTVTASQTQTHTPSSATLTASYRLSDAGSYRSGSESGASDVSFADSPSTLSRAQEIRRRGALSLRSYTSGYQTDASASQSDRDGQNRSPVGNGTGPGPGRRPAPVVAVPGAGRGPFFPHLSVRE